MKDYFVYLPSEPALSTWGCAMTSAGFTCVKPGVAYPQHRHPMDHHFDWKRGRTLQSYQLIFIPSGSGVFESSATPEVRPVESGSIIVLFPGVWHRYRPDAETGWVEHWVECRGPVYDRASEMGIIQPRHPLIKTGYCENDVRDLFERCHAHARIDAMSNQGLLSTLGLELLARLDHLHRSKDARARAGDDLVQRAYTMISLRCHEPLDMRAVASELGLGYSSFRHQFKKRTGISPRQHFLNARIQKAQELLAGSARSVKEVSDLLNFESPSHFSRQFKERTSLSPSEWREKMQVGP